MNLIAHHHHALDPAEGPDLDEEQQQNLVEDDDDTPIAGSDTVAESEGDEFD